MPKGWARDYFFVANGYEKDMDFYAYDFSASIRSRSALCMDIRILRTNRFLSTTRT